MVALSPVNLKACTTSNNHPWRTGSNLAVLAVDVSPVYVLVSVSAARVMPAANY